MRIDLRTPVTKSLKIFPGSVQQPRGRVRNQVTDCPYQPSCLMHTSQFRIALAAMELKYIQSLIGVAAVCFSNTATAAFHVNFYSDEGCNNYASSVDVTTASEKCYNYDVSWIHSIRVANCVVGKQVSSACCCTWFTDPNCKGAGYSANNWDGGTNCIKSDVGFQSYACDWELCGN